MPVELLQTSSRLIQNPDIMNILEHLQMVDELENGLRVGDEIIPIVDDRGITLFPRWKSEVHTPEWAEMHEGRVDKARMVILSVKRGNLCALTTVRSDLKPRHRGYLEIPSGHRSYRRTDLQPETPWETARRELLEELGIENPPEVIATFRDHFQGDAEQWYISYAATTFVMVSHNKRLKIQPDGAEVVGAFYIPVSFLATMEPGVLVPGAQEFYRDHRKDLEGLAREHGLF